MKIILIFISFLLSTSAFAGTYLKYGLGADDRFGTVKKFALGYQDELISVFDYQIEGGTWIDNLQGRRSSGYFSISPGISIIRETFYIKAFNGLSLIANTDSRLGGHFQFKHDLEFGFKDRRGVGIGLWGTHFSSAGITEPNLGRDFYGIKLQIPY